MAASRVLAGGQLAHNLAALPPGAWIMSSIQYFSDEYIGHDLGGLPLRPGGLDPVGR